ncbi:MAG: Na(+)/H(+) antiporter subunit D [Pseudomonadota bacterium]
MAELVTLLQESPLWLFLAGALFVFLIPSARLGAAVTTIVPLAALWLIWMAPDGVSALYSSAKFELTLMRVDPLSRVFGTIFAIAAFLCSLYAWHVRDRIQQIATLVYAGSAIGAVFAGDMVTLFFCWEGVTLASVFLIWQRGTEAAFRTGMRYLVWQLGAGVMLIAGIAIRYGETGALDFVSMTGGGPDTWTVGIWLIFIAVGIKCAFPLLHNWLQDAYPAATITGTVTLSAFTTHMAIYCMVRGFPGTELLIYIGAAMALFPLLFAEIQNDLRRVLAYSLNVQLGFMLVGVGIGTELALNGTVAHAVANILSMALLFMAVGAVMHRTGTSKASELGGLYRTMPWTMAFCVIGALSIAAFPLTSGFISRPLIVQATASNGYAWVWLALVVASVGVLCHAGIGVVYRTFFAHDSGKRPQEAPWNMRLAMGLAALGCIFLGFAPGSLHALLPYQVDFEPYALSNVISTLQLLAFALFAFALLLRGGFVPLETQTITLDTDWFYRVFFPAIWTFSRRLVSTVYGELHRGASALLSAGGRALSGIYGPAGPAARVAPTGTMVLWLAVLLGVVLALSLLDIG